MVKNITERNKKPEQFNISKKLFKLGLNQEIHTWQGCIILGFVAGFVSAFLLVSSRNLFINILETSIAQNATSITNQAEVTYQDTSSKNYGPVLSNIVTIAVQGGAVQDSTPPAQVTDLAIQPLSNSTIKLLWGAVGDDGINGTASLYDIRISNNMIYDSIWQTFSQIKNIPKPQKAGTNETLTVNQLNPGTYYFGIKTTDDSNNTSLLSNIPSITLVGTTDTTSPGKIVRIDPSSSVTNNSIPITWDAPGDDNFTGTASSYDIRYSTSAITDDATFLAATGADNVPQPQPSGSIETFTLQNLQSDTEYWIAIKSTDDASNVSPLSRVIRVTTNPTQSYKVLPNQIASIKVKIQPKGSYKRGFSNINLTLKDAQVKSDVAELAGDSDNQGDMTLVPNNIAKGNYHFIVKPPKLLSKVLLNIAADTNVNLVFSDIELGNLQDSDDVINTLDYAILSGKWGSSDPDADLNQDGIVNTLDWSLMNQNWGKQGEALTTTF